MDKAEFVEKLLRTMDEAKPGPITAEQVLTPEFIQKYTKFKDFPEMVQLAVKESGLLETYSQKLKEAVKVFAGR